MSLFTKLNELAEQRQTALKESREHWDAFTSSEDRGSDSAVEAKSAYDKAYAEYERIEAEVRTVQDDLEVERQLKEAESRNRDVQRDMERYGQAEDAPDPMAPNTSSSEEAAVNDAGYREAFFQALAFGNETLDPEQRMVLAQGRENRSRLGRKMEQRALTTGISSSIGGGNAVPTGFRDQLIEFMKFTGPMVPQGGLCFDYITEAGNNVDLPTLDDTDHEGELMTEANRAGATNTTAGTHFINDNDDPDIRKVTFGSVLVDSKFIKVSVEMLQDSGVSSLETILGQLGGKRLGRHINKRFTDTTKAGIIQKMASGQLDTAAGTAAVTIDELRGLIHKIDPAYRGVMTTGPGGNGGLTWMFSDSTLQYLANLKMPYAGTVGQGYTTVQYAFQLNNDLAQGQPATLMGRPFAVNQAMPAIATGKTAILLGDFSNAWIRSAGPMRMVVSHERFIEKLQVAWLVYARVDMELVNQNAFSGLTLK